MKMINLGCGRTFIEKPQWINLDFVATGKSVRSANLLKRLPFPSNKVAVIYSSHFLEHIPRAEVPQFLAECFRILASGGLIRLVVPDLENLCREYLCLRDEAQHEKADFVVLEMIDQCVRRKSGGELGRFYRKLRDNLEGQTDLVRFVRYRTGENLGKASGLGDGANTRGSKGLERKKFLQSGLQRLSRAVEWLRLKMALAIMPEAFRVQNVSLARPGELHQWLWDFAQLERELGLVGFVDVARKDCQSSSIPGFPFVPLDVDDDGLPRKGVESMFVEARKP